MANHTAKATVEKNSQSKYTNYSKYIAGSCNGSPTGDRYPTTILQIPQQRVKGGHPTQKPVALLEYLIKTYTKEGDTVLDFTMGSGSTGVAALNTGRDFIGIELDKQYYDMAVKRLDELTINNEDDDHKEKER